MFIDSIPDYLYCNKCNVVAREVVITSCCGESFCQACIADSLEQGQPCPACGEYHYSVFKHVRNRNQIGNLRLYCSVKERGCVWSGTLDQLDAHLDPHLDNCQYVDTKCPLNCLQTIPKNKVDQHVAQECTKRPHVCQHCGFKATYEEVVDTHLPECKYVALQCPNMCGVSCEREVMEDHMKTCRLEEVECEFSSVGCDGRFIREDQDKHARQNSQKHLTLTASLAVETKEQLQQKLLEQDKKHKEEIKKLHQQIKEQKSERNKIEELEKSLEEQQKIMLKLIKIQKESEIKISEYTRKMCLNKRFVMGNFSREKAKATTSTWKSPDMCTLVWGYKFYVGVDANGYGSGRGKSIYVDLWPIRGEFDNKLKWPARAQFTVELINQHGGENAKCTKTATWSKPRIENDPIACFERICCGFIEHSELSNFLDKNTLFFHVTVNEMF